MAFVHQTSMYSQAGRVIESCLPVFLFFQEAASKQELVPRHDEPGREET
jgi:hypothetical protein